MNKIFLTLSFLMGFVVLASNYLVQFPIKYYGLQDLLTYSYNKVFRKSLNNFLLIILDLCYFE